MITLERLRNAVLQATGYDELPPGHTLVDTVNEAHQAWAAEASWGYLAGRTYAVVAAAGDSAFVLPEAVVEVVDVWIGSRRVHLIDASEFEARTAHGWGVAGTRGTVRWQVSESGEPRATLAVAPALVATETVTVIYRGGAVRVEDTTSALEIPLPLEPAFLEWFRAYCRGSMLPEADLSSELARVRVSPMFRAALVAQRPHRGLDATPGMAGEHFHRAGLPWTR